jgi:hypothetical protein
MEQIHLQDPRLRAASIQETVDLAKADALLRDSLNENSRESSHEVNLHKSQIDTTRQEISGQINTQDLEKFIAEVYRVQGEQDAAQFLTKFNQARTTLEEKPPTSYSAQVIYTQLHNYGVEIQPEVFNKVVERTNAREKIVAETRSVAERLKLPADATPEQIEIEAAIREKVDKLMTALPNLAQHALNNPASMKKGFIRIELNENDIINKHSITFKLANILDANLIAVKSEEKSSFTMRIKRAIGFASELDDPAVKFWGLKSPAINDLFRALDDCGLKKHISYSIDQAGIFPDGIKETIKRRSSDDIYKPIYAVLKISL